ncbi:MAG: histidinol-phosphate transaminase [Pontiellaceae bacterium]|jgi:histidinol-phosphate aminotransferase|nr:histidinol-phosphate transaminase [Pontiellaceae bacterium]
MKKLIRKSVQAMSGYVPGEQPKGEGIIKLNTNENPWLCTPEVRDILNEIDVMELAKYPDPLCMEVRRVISEKHEVGPANIFAGNGSDEILALCVRAFCERDGSVGYFDPSYSLYPVLARIEEIAVKPVALDENYEWQMPEGYEASVFFLTNPNAPTGMLFPKKKVETFIQAFPGVVVIDEAYVDFARESCMEFATKYDNVLVARTLSKSYALAGIRFGYCVGAKALIDALHKIKDSYNVSRLTQELARVALLDEETMQAITAAVKGTRSLITEELTALGFKVYPSETNFVWVKPTFPGAKKIYDELRARNIFVRWFDGPRTKDCLRITVGTNEQMITLVENLEEILGK